MDRGGRYGAGLSKQTLLRFRRLSYVKTNPDFYRVRIENGNRNHWTTNRTT